MRELFRIGFGILSIMFISVGIIFYCLGNIDEKQKGGAKWQKKKQNQQ